MKSRRNIDDKFSEILNQGGLEVPTDQFSGQLMSSIVQAYGKNQVEEQTLGKWLGKAIVAILLCFNIFVLISLLNFSAQPLLIFSLGAFILGLWGLLAILKKNHTSRIDSFSKPIG